MQLRTDDFRFDNKNLSDFGFKVVNVQSSTNTRKIGLTRSLTTVDGVAGNKIIDGISETQTQFTITISKFNGDKIAPITNKDLKQITTWLYKPTDYKQLIAIDEESNIIYYGMFIDGEQTYLTDDNKGYITLTFLLDSNHAYGEEIHYVKEVDGTLNFTINFDDNVRGYYYPDVEFNVTGDSFSIKNITMNETMEFTDLNDLCRHGIIYGDGIMTMISVTDNKFNLRQKSNRKFVRLQNGNNEIEIKGNGTFTIKVQPKISLR